MNINAEKTTTEELIIGSQMLLNQYIVVVIGFNSIKLLSSNIIITHTCTRGLAELCLYRYHAKTVQGVVVLKGRNTGAAGGNSVMGEGLHCLLETITQVVFFSFFKKDINAHYFVFLFLFVVSKRPSRLSRNDKLYTTRGQLECLLQLHPLVAAL